MFFVFQDVKKVLNILTNCKLVCIIFKINKNMYLYNKNIMTKREYLLKVLEQLEPVWDLAAWLKLVVEQWALWDDVLDTLIWAVESGIHSVTSERAKEKMKKWLDALARMKQMEQQSALQDEKELAQLDELLDDF